MARRLLSRGFFIRARANRSKHSPTLANTRATAANDRASRRANQIVDRVAHRRLLKLKKSVGSRARARARSRIAVVRSLFIAPRLRVFFVLFFFLSCCIARLRTCSLVRRVRSSAHRRLACACDRMIGGSGRSNLFLSMRVASSCHCRDVFVPLFGSSSSQFQIDSTNSKSNLFFAAASRRAVRSLARPHAAVDDKKARHRIDAALVVQSNLRPLQAHTQQTNAQATCRFLIVSRRFSTPKSVSAAFNKRRMAAAARRRPASARTINRGNRTPQQRTIWKAKMASSRGLSSRQAERASAG